MSSEDTIGTLCKRPLDTEGTSGLPPPPKLCRQDDVRGDLPPEVCKAAAKAKEVFSNDFDPAAYKRMANDKLRLAAYTAAIGRAVKGRIVLDLGTGPECLLAILCARAGAERVIAVEVVPSIAEKAKRAVATAGLTDRIDVLVGYSTLLKLPRVDVVVHEIVGNISTEEGIAASLADLQLRPDVVDSSRSGWSVPCRVETMAAPTSLSICLPEDDESDVEVDPTIRLTFVPPPMTMLGDVRRLEVVDASEKISLQQESKQLWHIDKASKFTGFVCAPSVALDEESILDAWAQSTHWRHVLVQLDMPVEVSAGDEIELLFRADLRHFPVAHSFEVAVLRHQDGSPEKRRDDLEVIEVKLLSAC